MLYLLLCTIDADKLDLFVRLRAEHYAFLVANRHRIRFGGPARVAEGGAPETMMMAVEAASAEEAQAFIAGEPYTAHGGFSRVVARPWTQVLPEPEPGSLQRTLVALRADRAG